MFELLLSTVGKKSALDFPYSGPGPTTLAKGDTTLGFFGVINGSDIYQDSAFIEQADIADWISQINPNFNTVQWIKYMYQNKVCFTPMSFLTNIVSWKMLYDKGLIFGDDGTGQNVPAGYSVAQNKIYAMQDNNGKNWQFRLRLGTAPANPFTPEVNSTTSYLTELYKIFIKLSDGSWGNYTAAQLGASSILWMAAATASAGAPWFQMNGTLPYVGSLYSFTSANGNWRPVLEVIPQDHLKIVPITLVDALPQGSQGTVSQITGGDYTGEAIAQRLTDVWNVNNAYVMGFTDITPPTETLIDYSTVGGGTDILAGTIVDSYTFV
ncbi:virion structural protein [Pseudomonas phage PhiPA3]|uniref:Virion structural protein n=1 Tax=Pseudomonas phage PhiPA3 TaxID=998086 RepID=F8SJ81_BPPA3|nr:virion structural protein [Pseudomonas phage PhiPA3]AEH03661.1 virion structural protein [Pseudomonas phage PhiPA3]